MERLPTFFSKHHLPKTFPAGLIFPFTNWAQISCSTTKTRCAGRRSTILPSFFTFGCIGGCIVQMIVSCFSKAAGSLIISLLTVSMADVCMAQNGSSPMGLRKWPDLWFVIPDGRSINRWWPLHFWSMKSHFAWLYTLFGQLPVHAGLVPWLGTETFSVFHGQVVAWSRRRSWWKFWKDVWSSVRRYKFEDTWSWNLWDIGINLKIQYSNIWKSFLEHISCWLNNGPGQAVSTAIWALVGWIQSGIAGLLVTCGRNCCEQKKYRLVWWIWFDLITVNCLM